MKEQRPIHWAFSRTQPDEHVLNAEFSAHSAFTMDSPGIIRAGCEGRPMNIKNTLLVVVATTAFLAAILVVIG